MKKKRTSTSSRTPAKAIETIMTDLQAFLGSREWESIDEMNAALRELVAAGGPPAREVTTPLERAEQLVSQAWEEGTLRRQALARQALAISPDCADAYVLLAETARDLPTTLEYYRQGVLAGERAIGKKRFEEEAGHFWMILETRPYMRALFGLAELLWLNGEGEESVRKFEEMLRLNPNDNQGVRYILIHHLLELGEDLQVERLLEEYRDDGSACWAYSRALWTFRTQGEGTAADDALTEAVATNPHIPRYLLGGRKLSRRMPEYYEFGDRNEAVIYDSMASPAWQITPGALSWLERWSRVRRRRSSKKRRPLDPS